MVALKQEPFITIKGEPFRYYDEAQIGGNGATPFRELTVAGFLLMVLDSFQPMPQLGMILNMGEIRCLNAAAVELESEKIEDHYSFSPEQMSVIKKVVDWWLPLMPSGFMRNGPKLVDYLEAAG